MIKKRQAIFNIYYKNNCYWDCGKTFIKTAITNEILKDWPGQNYYSKQFSGRSNNLLNIKMFSLHQDLAQDCYWEWFFTGVTQFAAVGCLCVRTRDFFQGGLYRIDYWLVVFSIRLCVWVGLHIHEHCGMGGEKGALGCPYLPGSLAFLLPGMAPLTLALMGLHGMCWKYVLYSARIFLCKMEVWYLFSLSTSLGMDHEG